MRRPMTILVRGPGGRLVPFRVDTRGKDAEQIALGLDDELFAEMHRRRHSRGKFYSLEDAHRILRIPVSR